MKSEDVSLEELSGVFEIRINNGKQELWRKVHPMMVNRDGEEKIVPLTLDSLGYCSIRFKDRMVKYHRVLWILANGPIPEGMDVHHKDGNRVNNQLCNLGLVSRRENCCEKDIHREGKSPGWRFHKQSGLYQCRIKAKGQKEIALGYTDNEEWANKIYKKACEMVHLFSSALNPESAVDRAMFKDKVYEAVGPIPPLRKRSERNRPDNIEYNQEYPPLEILQELFEIIGDQLWKKPFFTNKMERGYKLVDNQQTLQIDGKLYNCRKVKDILLANSQETRSANATKETING